MTYAIALEISEGTARLASNWSDRLNAFDRETAESSEQLVQNLWMTIR